MEKQWKKCQTLFFCPPVAQAGRISASATPFLFLSSANTLPGSMSHTVISLSNDYSSTPLLLSPENVFSFFFFFPTWIHWEFYKYPSPGFFLLTNPLLSLLAFYPKSGRNQVMPSMLWLEMSSSNFQHHLQILPSTKCWDTTQVKFFAFL